MGKKRNKRQGAVQKVIKPLSPSQPEKAQIDIQGTDDLYREIQIDNVVTDENGDKARLKEGAEVEGIVKCKRDLSCDSPWDDSFRCIPCEREQGVLRRVLQHSGKTSSAVGKRDAVNGQTLRILVADVNEGIRRRICQMLKSQSDMSLRSCGRS
jgi:hypothetical protein